MNTIRNPTKLVDYLVKYYGLEKTISIIQTKYGVQNSQQFVEDFQTKTEEDPKLSALRSTYVNLRNKARKFKNSNCKTALSLKSQMKQIILQARALS